MPPPARLGGRFSTSTPRRHLPGGPSAALSYVVVLVSGTFAACHPSAWAAVGISLVGSFSTGFLAYAIRRYEDGVNYLYEHLEPGYVRSALVMVVEGLEVLIELLGYN